MKIAIFPLTMATQASFGAGGNSLENLMAEITQENLIRFFESYNRACQMCDGTHWLATPINQPIVNGMLTPDGNYDIPPPAFLTVAIVCQNCGYVRHHDAEIVKKWISTQ